MGGVSCGTNRLILQEAHMASCPAEVIPVHTPDPVTNLTRNGDIVHLPVPPPWEPL